MSKEFVRNKESVESDENRGSHRTAKRVGAVTVALILGVGGSFVGYNRINTDCEGSVQEEITEENPTALSLAQEEHPEIRPDVLTQELEERNSDTDLQRLQIGDEVSLPAEC